MGAIQPFISGAISKTVNLPHEATVDEVMETFVEAWRNGLKAIAIYRDGSKRTQPLSTAREAAAPVAKPVRRRLPDTRNSITHKFSIEGHEGYITVGTYEDGSPGEIFITMAKEGSTISGMMDAFATSISLTLQYGVPLKDLVNKFGHMRFEPAGMTQNREIPVAQSVVDYVFRWLGSQFLDEEEKAELGILSEAVRARLEAELRQAGGVRHQAERAQRPGRRAALHELRLDHDAQRDVLSLRELRQHERLFIGMRHDHCSESPAYSLSHDKAHVSQARKRA